MQHYCEIPTPKGVMRGFFHKPNCDKHPVCLIFHGFTGQKTGTKFCYVQLSRMLEAKGIASFRFDFLGSGESDLNFKDMTFKDELACARVILEEALKMENCTEVYVLGHSMGGAVASELAKLYPKEIKRDFYSMELCCNLLIRCSVDQRFEISFSYQQAGRRTYTSN